MIHKNTKKQKRRVLGYESQRGFTLIEVLVATFILLMAMSGTTFAITRGILFSGIARNQVTAFYLSQEALEYVKNKRDDNTLAASNWLFGWNGVGGPDCVNDDCVVDVWNDDIEQCIGECPGLLFDQTILGGTLGVYNHDAGDPTIFVRSIRITETSPNQEAVVEAQIYWYERGIPTPFSYNTRTILFNWQEL